MLSQLLEVSQALFGETPQWHVILLNVNLLEVQCLPAQNQTQMMRHRITNAENAKLKFKKPGMVLCNHFRGK